MLVAIILAVILSLLAFTSLVINIIIPSIDLTMYTVIFFAVTIIGWLFISYTLLNKRSRFICGIRAIRSFRLPTAPRA